MKKAVEMNYCLNKKSNMTFHSHTFYELYYFHEGRCNYVIGPNMYSLQPGDLILMHGMRLHSPNPDPRVPYVRTTIHFRPEYLQEFLNRKYVALLMKPFEELRNYRIQLGEKRGEVERILEEMGAWYKSE